MKCGSCQYFADYTDLRLGLRCMNKLNSPVKGDFMILEDDKSSCSHYKTYSPENLFEWDENKNRKNVRKHGIGFERIHDLSKDKFKIQMVEQSNKWEDLSRMPDHIENNEGNTDPIRGKWIGSIDGDIYTAIYTFRGGLGEMRVRIISLRRADKHDCKSYEDFKLLY